jgi:hypothetical protein
VAAGSFGVDTSVAWLVVPFAVTSSAQVTSTVTATPGPPPPLVGGLRARLLRDSCILALETGLDELGWFDNGRRHRSITFAKEPLRYDEPVEPNLIGLSLGDLSETDIEVGSSLVTASWALAVDVFAEDESLGQHLWGDIRDLLRGRLASRVRSTVPIMDLRQATPSQVGYAEVVDVIATRQWAMVEAPWQRTWFRVEATVEDTYFGELIPQAEAP